MKRISYTEYHRDYFNTHKIVSFLHKDDKIINSLICNFYNRKNLNIRNNASQITFNYTDDDINDIDGQLEKVDICDVNFYKYHNNIFTAEYYNFSKDEFVYYVIGNIEELNSTKLHYILENLLTNPNIIQLERTYDIKQLLIS
jgi:hypothetical protein